MSEKNFNFTVSDFCIYPKSAVSCPITNKSVIRKIEKVFAYIFAHICDYDFWVSEHNKKLWEKIKQRNNRRLNSYRVISYTLSSASYKNFETAIND